MGFLAPAALTLAVTIPIVIAMYLLKLRRTEQVVSSVYLWRRMVRDVEANAPWQKLRRNLLLFVQILFLAALILALARPYTWTEGVGGQAAILILDVSASMAATDVAPSRLGAAKVQAQRLVDELPDDVRVTVIAAGEGAQVLAASSLDRRQVRLAIADAGYAGTSRTSSTAGMRGTQVGAATSDLTAALELASAIAARQPDTEIVIFSDGRVTLPERLAIRGHVRYMPMGLRGDNQAISLLSLQTAAGGGLTAFAQVTNYSSTAAQRRLALYADGQLVSAQDLDIAPGAQRAVIAEDLPTETRVLEARLSGEDILAVDDRAWAVYRQAEPVAVTLVTEGNLFLETALALFPHLEVTTVKPEDMEEWKSGSMEERKDASLPTFPPSTLPSSGLVILDAYVPITATLPSGNLLFIAPPRSTPFFSVTGTVEQPVPRAVSAADVSGAEGDPLLAHVNLAEVSVLEAVRLPLPSWARPVVAGDTVAGDTTPLLFVGQVGSQRVAVLAFDLRRSDLPLQVAFPLLLANLIGWLAPGTGGSMPTQVAPGAAVSLSLPPDVESVRVTYPDGSTTRLAVEAGQAIVADNRQLGVYRLEWGAGTSAGVPTGAASFAVNLFSPGESDVQPAANLPLMGSGEGGKEPRNAPQQARREWWRPLAWAALALLTVEWFIYQRATLVRLWATARNAVRRRAGTARPV